MVSRNLLVLFAFWLLFLLLCFDEGNSSPLAYDCPNNTMYNTNSTSGRIYRRSLDTLLSALVSNASQPNGFYNYTFGGVYGLFLCRGDVKTSDCQDCLKTAQSDVPGLCPNETSATIWYENCMLRYSNQSIFSTMDTRIGWFMNNPQNVTDTNLFSQVLGDIFAQIRKQAANDVSGKKFAVKDANFTSFQERVYALGQCTPDLSSWDCGICLTHAIDYLPVCCRNSQGAAVLFPSCNIRYDTHSFYKVVAPPPEPTTPNLQPLPPPHLPGPPSSKGASFGSQKLRNSVRSLVIAIPPSVVSCIVLAIVAFVLTKKRSTNRRRSNRQDATDGENITMHPESLQYSLTELKSATNNFSADNKVGQGGFGCVYKGKLPNGQYIAVKRLSRNSGQGAAEFKNEIGVVANLQHKNLVRLLGFCLEGEEKILVYEFVPNRSLDYFLFDPEKQGLLNWSRRRNIIRGIARGLLYLHQDSRLKIVHRDLKTGNILLDQSMDPKIADFGMAKICGVDEHKGTTTRIAGTFGYMAPEYTRRGQYSVKSDVFSFGVVVLEIITGKKNSCFYKSEDSEDLISYAWRQWRDGTPLALLDPTIIGDCYVKNEVIQCVHIGLLCVEEDPDKRPTMASVVYMLNRNSVNLPTLNPPAVSCKSRSKSLRLDFGSDQENTESMLASIAEASITEPYPR